MPSLWIVTPAYRRFELTRLVFEQRRRLLVALEDIWGIDAHQLVVADDPNLDTAAEAGFKTLERPNELGRRINDGFEHACARGADYVVYAGSDDWMLADWLVDLPPQGRVRASGRNAWTDGTHLWTMESPPVLGDAPWVVSREALCPLGFRPVDNSLMSGVDTSMWTCLGEHLFDFHPDDDPLRWVGFKGGGTQITPLELQIRGGTQYPFDHLATRYPTDLVERMKEFYAR